MLLAAGLSKQETDQLIVKSFAEYEERAVRLAQQPQLVMQIKQHLAAARFESPLFDTPRFVQDFEKAIWYAWKARIDGKATTLIDVASLPPLP
jgi:predicted O-linked N-acetylglucosamine transferase (SPINDLY family)